MLCRRREEHFLNSLGGRFDVFGYINVAVQPNGARYGNWERQKDRPRFAHPIGVVAPSSHRAVSGSTSGVSTSRTLAW